MEQVDDGDGFAVELLEIGVLVLNDHSVFNGEDLHITPFHEEGLALDGKGSVG